MKITAKPQPPATFTAGKGLNQQPGSDLNLSRKSALRRIRNPSFVRLKRSGGASVGRRSRPETPLLKWKTEDKDKNDDVEDEEVEDSRRGVRRSAKVVSARKLAAGLWRLQMPETVAGGGGGGGERRHDPVVIQPGGNHVDIQYSSRRSGKSCDIEGKDQSGSPCSVSGAKNGLLYQLEPAFQFSNSLMEGATKWDPVSLETSDDVHQIYGHMKRLDQQVPPVSVVSALESELEQARARIQELQAERRSSKKKLEQFLKKVSEERAVWRSREHEKVRVLIDDMKSDLNRERKTRKRIEIVNSKLVNELENMKLSAKRYMQEYEKERKARELIEEVCDELAREIGDDKAEVEEWKRESTKIRDEVDDERKMLQMAEVWREERVQMKLIDAKVALEEKYSQMNKLVADLENFLRSRNEIVDVKEMRDAELLRQAVKSVNIQDMKEFTYVPSNPDDIFAVFEDVNFGVEIEPSPASHASKIHTVTPEGNKTSKNNIPRFSNAYDEEIDEDESGWETVSHVDDQGSSYSPEGEDSIPSVNKNYRENNNISESGTECCENDIGEVCSIPNNKQFKKVSSIARLWRSNNGENYKIISIDGVNNGRLSNGRKSTATLSPDHGSKGGLSPVEFIGDSSSPESGNPHIARAMKGCIEWPRGIQRGSLKAKLLEARIESQKVQLRHVLKQKF